MDAIRRAKVGDACVIDMGDDAKLRAVFYFDRTSCVAGVFKAEGRRESCGRGVESLPA